MSLVFKKISIALIIIFSFMIVMNIIFGESTIQILQKEQIGTTGLYWYKPNVVSYFQNITTSYEAISYFEIEEPPLLVDQSDATFLNGLISATNVLILILNIILIPFRFIFYVVRIALAFLGVNMQQGGLSWLARVCEAILKLEINYIGLQ